MDRPWKAPPRDTPCSVDGCDIRAMAKGLCSRHYGRQRHGLDLDQPWRGYAEYRLIDHEGYVRLRGPGVCAPGTYVREHRYVMEKVIGRPLLPDEHVHHRNGDRADNRPENLELWSSTHPSGQRVADLMAWAREIMHRYEDLPLT